MRHGFAFVSVLLARSFLLARSLPVLEELGKRSEAPGQTNSHNILGVIEHQLQSSIADYHHTPLAPRHTLMQIRSRLDGIEDHLKHGQDESASTSLLQTELPVGTASVDSACNVFVFCRSTGLSWPTWSDSQLVLHYLARWWWEARLGGRRGDALPRHWRPRMNPFV